MPLDIHITTKSKTVTHIELNESLHSQIFSNSTRWSSLKKLRRIKDYYRADFIFYKTDAESFAEELLQALDELNIGKCDLRDTFEGIKGTILTIRITSD